MSKRNVPALDNSKGAKSARRGRPETEAVQRNSTSMSEPDDMCVHELFEQRALAHPDAVAVVEEGRETTYGELNARANRLARYLRRRGVKREARVGVLLPRSTELVVAELAILKCGAAYVALDENAPPERHAFILADCQADLVLVGVGATPPRCEVPAFAADAFPTKGPAGNVGLALESGMTAYVMYTSGSTGQPKGVEVPHRAVRHLVCNGEYARFEASDRVGFVANPAFGPATIEVWAPLLHGGRIIVVSRATLLDVELFGAYLQSQHVSVLHLTSGLFRQYAVALADALQVCEQLVRSRRILMA